MVRVGKYNNLITYVFMSFKYLKFYNVYILSSWSKAREFKVDAGHWELNKNKWRK